MKWKKFTKKDDVLENELYNTLNTNIDFNPKFKANIELTPVDKAVNAICFASAVSELAGEFWRTNKVDVEKREMTMVKEHMSVTFNFKNYTYRVENSKDVVKGVDLN